MRLRAAILVVGVGIALFFGPVGELALAAANNSLYTHLFFIPIFCAYLVWLHRRFIFSDLSLAPARGVVLLIIGALAVLLQLLLHNRLVLNDRLFVQAAGLVIYVWGAFVLLFGVRAFRRALFPMLFLMFMIPLPSVILAPFEHLLQAGSAHAADAIMRFFGVPAHQNGMDIAIPGVTIEVARQCSGIRSALALMIISSVAGYMFLRSPRRRVLLVLAVIPITIFKNGLRIATLALLGAYVDMAWLTDSWLHREGGKPFLLLGLALMAPILWALVRNERKHGKLPESDDSELHHQVGSNSTPSLAD
jgi:exosortase